MERMKQLTVCIDDGLQGEVVYRAEISHTEEDYQELKSDLVEFVREENKKLEEENEYLYKKLQEIGENNFELKKENKNLNEENNRLKNNAMEDMRVQTKLEDRIKELEQCNLNLQTWLDNKEKVNKSLREELEELKSTYVYDAKQVRDIC